MNRISKSYLVVKGAAGLGNRFITLVKAINYAKDTKRCVLVDWADGMFGAVGDNVFYKYFELNNVNHTQDKTEVANTLCNGASGYPHSLSLSDLENPIFTNFYPLDTFLSTKLPVYRVLTSLMFKHKLGYFFGLQSWQRRTQKKRGGYWWAIRNINSDDNFPLGGNLSYSLKEDIVLFSDFRPLCNVSKMFDYIHLKDQYYLSFKQFATQKNLKNAIGVHVRATDKKPKQKIIKLFNKIDNMLKKEPSLNIFLSTDNTDVEKEFREKYNTKILTYPKFLPQNLETGMHRWAEKNTDESLKEKMFEECLADMWLLSMCKYLFWQGNSSFSYISKLLKNDKSTSFNWMGLLR